MWHGSNDVLMDKTAERLQEVQWLGYVSARKERV